MAKLRVLAFLSTLIIVGLFGVFASYYARGYRLNIKTFKFEPNGILVIKSEPDGASVYINGDLKTATNATVSLSPGTYDIDVKKDGFFTWSKRMVIEKEIVTTATISLFKVVPSLSPTTFFGARNPVTSKDGTKIAFIVDKTGLWTLDTFNFPLGFTNEPKKITDGDLTNASYVFSPDGRQILLTISDSIFLLDSGSFTPQSQRVNIAPQVSATQEEWATIKKAKEASLTRNLPPELTDILVRKSKNFTFSPDENMVMYTSSASANLPDNLIKQLPGASTQRQERNIQANQTYVYDIKEDRNFLVNSSQFTVDSPPNLALRWMPDSRHLLLAQEGQVVIMDYDGTNRQIIYSGSYMAPNAFPFTNATKILILTNLGSASSIPNLYTLTVK
ncbi:MAG TPA: PEGA domain-containing protein [Alphaproteobacteria bacterium]|jgi:hypothetical protein|nr:PEGA domain-containing protein [Alphaproteobacteria bacterium]